MGVQGCWPGRGRLVGGEKAETPRKLGRGQALPEPGLPSCPPAQVSCKALSLTPVTSSWYTLVGLNCLLVPEKRVARDEGARPGGSQPAHRPLCSCEKGPHSWNVSRTRNFWIPVPIPRAAMNPRTPREADLLRFMQQSPGCCQAHKLHDHRAFFSRVNSPQPAPPLWPRL